MTEQQLKNSILQMAVQGKLVPQDPSDEPASVLLERIRAEKGEMIKEGKIKKEKETSIIFRGADNLFYERIGNQEPVCIADEVPFEIPESWEWVRLGEYVEKVTDQVASGSFASLRANVPSLKEADYAIMVKTADFSNGFTRNLTYTTKQGYDFLNNSNLYGGELILSNIGSIGKCFIVPKLDYKMTLAPNSVMVRLVYEELRDYLYYFILSPQGYEELLNITSGTATKKFNKTDLKTILIPVPPFQEQFRIICKVNEIIPFLDQYGAVEYENQCLNIHFPERLKKSILQMSIQGKLVPQDPNDEPASVLLKKIRAEKEQLIQAGKIKRDKHESVIYRREGSYYEKIDNAERCIDDEVPFNIPESWEWVRIRSVGEILRGNGIKRNDLVMTGCPCVRYGELYTTYQTSFVEAISFIPSEIDKKCKHIRHGDILMTLTGENKPDIAKAVAYLGTESIAIGGDLAYWSHHGLNPLFLSYVLASPYVIGRKVDLASGDIIVHISVEKIGGILFPIPPYNEQNRIVNKIEDLLSMIDYYTDIPNT